MSILKSFADRIDRLDDEIKTMRSDIAEIYAEVKAAGYDKKVFRAAIKRARAIRDDSHATLEADTLVEIYVEAILGQGQPKSPPAASPSPANGIVEKEAPTRARAGAIVVQGSPEPLGLHVDPETGEILFGDDPGEIPAELKRSAA